MWETLNIHAHTWNLYPHTKFEMTNDTAYNLWYGTNVNCKS